jgi:stage II sporulation protein R
MMDRIQEKLCRMYAQLRNIRREFGKLTEKTGYRMRLIVPTAVLWFALYLGVAAAHQEMVQQGIAREVLRFHVLANSDSEEDQAVKYLVRDAVLDWLSENMDDAGKDEEEQFLAVHLADLEAKADAVLMEQGCSYRAKAELRRCYFPDRTYGTCTFPAGWYEALRIRLGEAQGQNWWCVLYPSLCFSDCLHAVVAEEDLDKIKSVLTAEEYETLLRSPDQWKFTFRWF